MFGCVRIVDQADGRQASPQYVELSIQIVSFFSRWSDAGQEADDGLVGGERILVVALPGFVGMSHGGDVEKRKPGREIGKQELDADTVGFLNDLTSRFGRRTVHGI